MEKGKVGFELKDYNKIKEELKIVIKLSIKMKNFIKKCKQRVELDEEEFNIKSVFFPNPIICKSPSFCLIGMEPSVNARDLEIFKEKVKQGYKNFLHSEQDFILHYCAYKFLCNGSFDYYITDISKGAMLTKDAIKYKNERYEKWLHLLKEELKLLGNPFTIAIGVTLLEKLRELNFKPDDHIPHYSWNNIKNIKRMYENIEKESPATDFNNYEIILKDFSCKLMKYVGYSDDMIMERIEKIFIVPLPEWKKNLLALYRYKFKKFRKKYI